ncbi:hypothetical protein AKJ39_03300 [candidate division MSBL1 archaeon SCGC-AAA259J03]|uniref:Uncharacterized protein n=1 Tax=candidate division MSBL1 archaeon SCGC-AAA259J03 TaxID=1698269 RepID=A0A656YYK8_9EURY|nr:hypothetical protein AKJ39_03300 [candidate division MSBL1 archaeon SCGC-AAA259J03]
MKKPGTAPSTSGNVDKHSQEKGREKVENLNELILETLFSPKELTIAIDFTTIPYYGEENPMLVSDSRQSGASISWFGGAQQQD